MTSEGDKGNVVMMQRIKSWIRTGLRFWSGHDKTAPENLLAVFTMVYNEDDMLPVWARYYVQQVGEEHVYVLDHGSDSLPALEGCRVKTIKRGSLDEVERAKLVGAFQKKLLKRYRFVLFTDCDEILIARPEKYSSLRDYAQHCQYNTVQCVGVDVVQQVPDLRSVEWNKPVLAQRPYGAVRPWSCKPLLSSVPLSWQAGFHTCDQPLVFDKDLWMIHLKYADEKRVFKRLSLTRSLNWSKKALALQHGSSHRMSDQDMRDFFIHFQKQKEDTDLDSLDLQKIVLSGAESRLHRIPKVFCAVI